MRYADQRCTYKEVYEPKHVYVFTGPCMMTGKPYSVTIPAEELYAYRQGGYIQDTLRSLSADDREFLMSGMSPEAWSDTFDSDAGQGEDDEYDDG